jgi:hypothetical protein
MTRRYFFITRGSLSVGTWKGEICICIYVRNSGWQEIRQSVARFGLVWLTHAPEVVGHDGAHTFEESLHLSQGFTPAPENMYSYTACVELLHNMS